MLLVLHSTLSLLLLLAFTLTAADNTNGIVQQQPLWCVAMNNAEDSALEQALNWACGPGAADCGPIQPNGPCYDANDLIGMASFAFNSYCLKNGMSDETCDFSHTAALSSLDPSHDKCKFPSSTFSAANSTTPSTAGILPGSEVNASPRLVANKVLTLVLAKLFVAVFTVFL